MEDDGRFFRDRLRRSVLNAHRRIDHHPLMRPLLDRSLTIEQYVAVLQAFDHFYRSATPELEKLLCRYGSGYAFADRRPWLKSDIEALNCGADLLFPQIYWPMPAVTGAEELIGLLYVLEGSLLGGQFIARNLRGALGLTPDFGACFFNGLGDETGRYWKSFLAYAEAGCSREREGAAIDAARATFACLEHGFDEVWARSLSAARSRLESSY
jgi:heme oxygenase (biliverdin-IX-beta and delta-forming)